MLVSSNTVNRIPIPDMLFNSTDKFMEKGHKVFKAVDTNNLKAFLLSGKKIMQRFSSLRNFVDTADVGEPIKLTGTRGVANLVINGRLNNVSVTELLQQLFYADKNPTINGKYLVGGSHIGKFRRVPSMQHRAWREYKHNERPQQWIQFDNLCLGGVE